MSRRTLIRIIVAAVLLHVGAFLYFGRYSAMPKSRYEAPPNFGFEQITYVDPKTGESTVEQRIRVSTRLAPPGTYEAYKPHESDESHESEPEPGSPADPSPPSNPPPQ